MDSGCPDRAVPSSSMFLGFILGSAGLPFIGIPMGATLFFHPGLHVVCEHIFLASGGQTKHCLAAGGKETTTDSETSWERPAGSSSLSPQHCCIQHMRHRGERPGLEVMNCLLLAKQLLAVTGGDTLDLLSLQMFPEKRDKAGQICLLIFG